MRVLLTAIFVFTLGCQKPHGPARCYGPVDCASDEVCVRLTSTAQTCVDTCDATSAATCPGGEACVPVDGEDAEVDVCLPGGRTGLGDVCGASAECVVGAICVTRPGRDAVCELSCTVGEPNLCGDTESCVVVDAPSSPTRGTCSLP